MTTAKLALEDGAVYTGRAFGSSGEAYGEVVTFEMGVDQKSGKTKAVSVDLT